METEFTSPWADAAIDRIYSSSNLREAITTTSSYISDIIEELRRLNCDENGDAEYLPFIDEIIELIDDGTLPECLAMWEATRATLEIYALIPGMQEWEVEFEATQRLAPYIDPQMDRLEGAWMLMGNIITHHQGWIEGEMDAIIEWNLEESVMDKDWPESFPEDKAPDGLEEYVNVGWD